MKDYYKILDVSRSASQDDIKKVYRKLAFLYHPDRNSDASAVLKMKEINEAFDVLGDETKRKAYNFKLENREAYQAANQTRSYTQRPNNRQSQRQAKAPFF